MTEQPPKRTRLNVGVDEELHRDLRLLAAELNEPFTKLVPRLLRAAIRAERAQAGKH